jgi:hypothetical protein
MRHLLTAFGLCLFAVPTVRGQSSADFRPDPRSIQRHGSAYRYPQAGWIVLHIEGEPYERGYQHGRLLAPEIAEYVRASAAIQSSRSPSDGWKATRSLVNALFVRRYDKEYLEEMRGIADGATAAGARFEHRPIDLVDIVALNCWPEIETLDSALEATPTGLEGMRFPGRQPRAMPPPKPMHCSAFAATAPATADGKIVFGHITMFSLYPSRFYNVWLDVKPAKGHRVFMQSYPGGIQSGMDYYFNDAGLLVSETTIKQTRFDVAGLSLASRIRQALQYADGIDGAVEILKKGNNGLYTNEWLLADTKTNEIAMFELGTAKSKLYRSGKGEWFGGTEGFYWGCNNAKDLDVRMETVASVDGRPANVVWKPSDRDKMWLRMYGKHKGKIDVAFGKEAFTTPPVAAYHSLDAKFTTTDLAKDLKTWALFGPPLGRTWHPTHEERKRFPEIHSRVSNPWTVLHGAVPAREKVIGPAVVDLSDRLEGPVQAAARDEEDRPLPTLPVWHGTLLPRTDADTWLAAAFADYERIVALENAMKGRRSDGELTRADRERLVGDLYAHRSGYLAAARAKGDVPLARTRSDVAADEWYRVAAGKGVLLLHELRQVLGDRAFVELMDAFGRTHAGREVTAAEFQQRAEKATGRPLGEFFDFWLQKPGLPPLKLEPVKVEPDGKRFRVEGSVMIAERSGRPQASVAVTVETANGEETKKFAFEGPAAHFEFTTTSRPLRVIVDKYGVAKENGGVFSVQSFNAELERTLIVYGTGDELATNREAAEALQKAIIERGPNLTVPIKSDKDVTEDDLKSHHLLLVGRPDSNRVIERFRGGLPVAFGSRSFAVGREAFGHPGSAVVAAAENPLNGRYSVVVLAGLDGDSTLHAPAALLHRNQRAAEVLVLPHGGKPRALVVPARDLVRELPEK